MLSLQRTRCGYSALIVKVENPASSMADGGVRRLRSINTRRVNDPVPPRLKPRGVPAALSNHEVYATGSVGIAEQLGREIFGSHELHVDDAERDDFLASMHAVRFRDITMGYIDFVAATRIDIDRLPDDYTVFMVMNGESRTSNLSRTANTNSVTAVVPAPGTAAMMEWSSHSPHLVIRLDHEALDLHVTRLIGRSLDRPLRFDLQLDMSPESANRWSASIQLLHSELFHPDSLLHLGLGTGPLEEFVMSALLFSAPSNYTSWLARPQHAPGRRAVRHALDYIETHLSEPITIADIAAAGETGIRSLEQGFHEELNCTPTAYLRDRRLDRARLDLVEASPIDHLTVTDIAMRWGFGHLGRFASSYRSRFGESPSQTLRS